MKDNFPLLSWLVMLVAGAREARRYAIARVIAVRAILWILIITLDGLAGMTLTIWAADSVPRGAPMKGTFADAGYWCLGSAIFIGLLAVIPPAGRWLD